jgi:hypothetical protein
VSQQAACPPGREDAGVSVTFNGMSMNLCCHDTENADGNELTNPTKCASSDDKKEGGILPRKKVLGKKGSDKKVVGKKVGDSKEPNCCTVSQKATCPADHKYANISFNDVSLCCRDLENIGGLDTSKPPPKCASSDFEAFEVFRVDEGDSGDYDLDDYYSEEGDYYDEEEDEDWDAGYYYSFSYADEDEVKGYCPDC